MKQKKNPGIFCKQLAGIRKLSVPLLATTLLMAAGCKKEISPNTNENGPGVIDEAKPAAAVIVVHPGSSIQAAVDAAGTGTVIKIRPGTYQESIIVNKPDITLMGEGKVVIQNPGNAAIGITVADGADGFALKNITIRGFKERGVQVKDIDGFLLSQVTASNDGEFGLFVQFSQNGTVEHSEATGHTDTGIFVGESTNVTVSQNKVHGNTIGVETENASFITITKNQAYDNTAGILCLLVPHPSVVESTTITITKNQVRENNHPNLQTGSGELETVLPQGIGILLLGVNNTLVQDNHVTGNKYTGIAVVGTAIFSLINPDFPLAGIEPHPDYVTVISNQVKNNGYDPQAVYLPPLPGVDLLWLGPAIGAPGTGNCWSKNLYGSSFPDVLPACP